MEENELGPAELHQSERETLTLSPRFILSTENKIVGIFQDVLLTPHEKQKCEMSEFLKTLV